ncbi:MAG: nuclear transport factor 2 family protein [Aquabacterium sp.]|jgi:uncharacterized protein (TIGR02246 family)|nr:nuclear transport factor 2 family protein [Aquabacterium sp.]
MRSKAQTAHLMASPDDVETQFYEAVRDSDLERLMAVWADDDDVVCVLPGGPRLVGVAAVRAAFEALFSSGRFQVVPEQVRRVHTLDAAMHSMLERVEIRSAEGVRTGYVVATNVYRKTSQGWRLVAHHASPGSTDAPPDISEAPSVLH